MREVEIKIRVNDVSSLLEHLSKEGVHLSNHIHQVDRIFVAKPFRLSQIDAKLSPVLRIREEGGRYTLTLKRDVTDQLDSIEHEVQVDNPVEAAAILDDLGCHEVLVIRKTRRKCMIDGFSACLDHVDELGGFMELEWQGHDADASAVRNSMRQTFDRLGLSGMEEVKKGYDRLLEDKLTVEK